MRNISDFTLHTSHLPCDSGGTRTLNPQNRNLIFYPLNYGAVGAKLAFSRIIVFIMYSKAKPFKWLIHDARSVLIKK
jgi:hypothetical protein